MTFLSASKIAGTFLRFADMHLQLFAKYFPSILPLCRGDDMDGYVTEARQIQQDLRTHPSYVPGDNFIKRKHCTYCCI